MLRPHKLGLLPVHSSPLSLVVFIIALRYTICLILSGCVRYFSCLALRNRTFNSYTLVMIRKFHYTPGTEIANNDCCRSVETLLVLWWRQLIELACCVALLFMECELFRLQVFLGVPEQKWDLWPWCILSMRYVIWVVTIVHSRIHVWRCGRCALRCDWKWSTNVGCIP